MFAHSVYIGFRFFMLLEINSGDTSSMPWSIRKTVVLLAKTSDGYDPARPPRQAPGPDPTLVRTVSRLYRFGSIVGVEVFFIPGF